VNTKKQLLPEKQEPASTTVSGAWKVVNKAGKDPPIKNKLTKPVDIEKYITSKRAGTPERAEYEGGHHKVNQKQKSS